MYDTMMIIISKFNHERFTPRIAGEVTVHTECPLSLVYEKKVKNWLKYGKLEVLLASCKGAVLKACLPQ